MLIDLKTFERHDYVAKEDRIGYKEQDNVVFDTSYSYKTLFAYFFENEKGNISEDSLNKNISILIRLGSFSYAEVPLKFDSILGVTGTLKTLSEPELEVIEKVYNIKFKTYIPSCYGRNNLIFDPKEHVLIESEQNYYKIIAQEIDQRIVGQTLGTKRAVFVVFESKNELIRFFNSEAFMPFKSDASILTEEASLQEKNNIINNATLSGIFYAIYTASIEEFILLYSTKKKIVEPTFILRMVNHPFFKGEYKFSRERSPFSRVNVFALKSEIPL